MGTILQNFTVTRNIMGRNAEVSASRLRDYIELVGDGLDAEAYSSLSKGETNDISALASYTGIFEPGEGGGYVSTELNNFYRDIQEKNITDAWQWLITRSLWHFILPNGSTSPLNRIVRDKGIKINFFKNIVGLLSMLSAFPGNDRFLYFHEICLLFDNDDNWSDDALALFTKLIGIRAEGSVTRERHLLDDLETEFGISRDNLNTVIVKAFSQTGLFQFKEHVNGTKIGISISNKLSNVLQRRIRHILDFDLVHELPETNWRRFIAFHDNDLPLEVEEETIIRETDDSGPADIAEICKKFHENLTVSGLVYSEPLLQRFVSGLLAKPFLILTGLSGSGKTKLAHSFASWLTPAKVLSDPFKPGNNIESERITYFIKDSDKLSVGFSNSQDPGAETLVTLPRAMIEEWANYIEANSLTRDVSARQIREGVSPASKFSSQLHSFETQLKAAAFALLESRKSQIEADCYRIIPVGADWTGNENIIGYPNGLDNKTYVTKPALELIRHALEPAYSEIPHFLILDEMNLSHVERYFADMLSAIESGEEIPLYDGDERETDRGTVPRMLRLPDNLFVIGTVNVDETTYMFSPKVLDRANVIEFRMGQKDLQAFLDYPVAPQMEKLFGRGACFGSGFVEAAADKRREVAPAIKESYEREMLLFFNLLREHNAEFGYRTSYESARFIHFFNQLGGYHEGSVDWFDIAMDAVVVQKFLPKLHGSRSKLEGLLWALAWACGAERIDRGGKSFAVQIREASQAQDDALYGPETLWETLAKSNPDDPSAAARYPLSFDKVMRMWRKLVRDQFVTFAEA